jgi:hypothetical protein
MSLLWTAAAKRDYDELDSHIDMHAHDLPGHAGLRMDSPDLGVDSEFDDAFEHAGQCKNKACYPKFHMLDLTSGSLRGNEPSIDPEHVKRLVRTPSSGNLPEVLKLRGEHHILDGHHRLLSHMLRGEGRAPVLVHDGDAYRSSDPREHTHLAPQMV